jgi:GNAT superfamily N-acetyltransferase
MPTNSDSRFKDRPKSSGLSESAFGSLESKELPGFQIRPATPNDVEFIISMIRELAQFEKLEHEMVATSEKLEACLFNGGSTAEAVIGEFKGERVSFALFFPNFSTFLAQPGMYLEDLYVRPEFRSLGIGRLMLIYLARLGQMRGYGRFEWSVLDWNVRARAFYESFGATPMGEWTVHRTDGAPLEALAARPF